MQSTDVDERSMQEVTVGWTLAFEPGEHRKWVVRRLDEEGNEIEGSEVRFEFGREMAGYLMGYMTAQVDNYRERRA